MVQPLWKTEWTFLKKLKRDLASINDLAIPLLGIDPKQNKTKTPIQKDTCNPMFIKALSTIAKIYWIQSKCSLTDD